MVQLLQDDNPDASHWNFPWNPHLATKPINSVIFKLGEGAAWIDPNCFEYVDIAKVTNTPWGLYWFFRPSYSPIAAAKTVLDMVDLLGLPPEGVWADVEANDGKQWETIDSRLWTFMTELEKAIPVGSLGIYSRKYFFDYVSVNVRYARYKQWAAHYTGDPNKRPIFLMTAWTRAGKEEDRHQYTSRAKGSEYGFASPRLDMNTVRRANEDELTLEEKVDILWREAELLGWNLTKE